MNKDEAIAWLMGERSMCNTIPQDPFDTWQVRIAQADAAMCEQAYWILMAEALRPSPAGTQEPLVGTRPLHPNPDHDHAWWCPTCDRWVQNEHVTFEETHDTRNGGCGGNVE